MKDLTAVVFGLAASPAPLHGVAEMLRIDSIADVCEAARRAKSSDLWLLDACAAPTGTTLAGFSEESRSPQLSLVVDDEGVPLEALVGGFDDSDLSDFLEVVNGRRLPLRYSRLVSMLIPRDVVLAHQPPDPHRYGSCADIEWTARLFRAHGGQLAPASTVELAARRSGPRPIDMARLVRAGALRRSDVLRSVRLAALRAGGKLYAAGAV